MPQVTLLHCDNLEQAVHMARICYASHSKSTPTSDKRLLQSCVRKGHHSVLEHVSYSWDIEGVSRSCTHQLVRHRIGAAYSEQSQRYVRLRESKPVIPPSWKEKLSDHQYNMAHVTFVDIWDMYDTMIEAGVPVEDARYILPNATPSRIGVTFNWRSTYNFFRQRMDKNAQWEIRGVAHAMYDSLPPAHRELFDLVLDD